MIWTALLGLFFVVGSNAWVLAATRGQTYPSATAMPARIVAIVPGSKVSRSGRPLAVLTARLEAALELYRAHKVGTILVSGVEISQDPEVSGMDGWLLARGVPASAILKDPGGSRTRQTMLRASAGLGITSAIVCTEDLHMPRSLFLAREAGIDAVGVALPTPMDRSALWVGIEILKNTLAFVETRLDPDLRPLAPALAAR